MLMFVGFLCLAWLTEYLWVWGCLSDKTGHIKTAFSLDKKTRWHPPTSGFCLWWERLQSAFTPKMSNDSGLSQVFISSNSSKLQWWKHDTLFWPFSHHAMMCPEVPNVVVNCQETQNTQTSLSLRVTSGLCWVSYIFWEWIYSILSL